MGKMTAQYNTEKLLLAIFTCLIPAAIKHGFQGVGASSESEEEQDWLSVAPECCHLLEAMVREVPLDKKVADLVTR